MSNHVLAHVHTFQSLTHVVENQDYILIATEIVFVPGSADGDLGCAQVTIIDDSSLEFNEVFSLSLSAVSDPPGVTRAMTSAEHTDYTIVDDEGMSLHECIICYSTVHVITDGQMMCFTHTQLTFPSFLLSLDLELCKKQTHQHKWSVSCFIHPLTIWNKNSLSISRLFLHLQQVSHILRFCYST